MAKNASRGGQIQDAVREEMMMEMFDLKDSGEGRIGADAIDGDGRRFELKSGTKKSVTTARDVGLHTLDKWQGKHWLVGFGNTSKGNFEFTEIYYLSPSDMGDFCNKISEKISPDLQILTEVKSILEKLNYDDKNIERLEYLVNRGYTLNNPKIPYKYIVEHGIKLDSWVPSSLSKAISSRLKQS